MTILFVGVIACCSGKPEDGVPLIFAAASLSDVLTESAEIYERETGKRVNFSFGGSITLANQVATLGAPADGVFLVGEQSEKILEDLVGSSNPANDGWVVFNSFQGKNWFVHA